MYGLGLLKGLAVTMKNLALPGRMFTTHQYPSRGIGILGLAKMSGTNVVSFAFAEPKQAAKALEFEKAALLRDEMVELRKVLASGKEPELDSKLVSKKL